AYFHTKAIHGSVWIWPSFVVWALDRCIRLVRLVVSNHLYFGFTRRSGSLHATTELLCEDFVRVRLRRPPHFHWSPGQSAYLIMPSVSTLPFEAHPFSISSIDSSLFHQHGDDHSEYSEDSAAAYWKELVFVVNVRGGFTKRLKEVAARNETIKVFVDGPYGSPPDLGGYDTSVLVAGGTGVTYTLPVFLSIVEAVRNGSSNCRRVVFIWAVRDARHLDWVSDALSRANSLAPSSLTVSIQIFVTSGLTAPNESDLMDQDQVSEKDHEDQAILARPWLQMENGRPNLKAILREEVDGAVGRMSVSVCGSQGFTRSVRHALRFPVSGPCSILYGGPSVTLYVESFGYA
ncbi:hypothetical protein PAXRUDRAFT_171085, partial [Paxillus rubicundulus Ve08.2h10]